MADYKILQNIDLAQNEIKEVSKIANDRTDDNYKGLLIQTGDDTSLTLNRKVGENSNYIKGIVKEEISSGKTNESIFTVNPSEVNISNESKTISDANYATSKLTLGLYDNKEHIEAVSPLVDINTGDTEYTDPHISLDKKKSTLGLKSSKIEASSKRNSKSSTLTMEDTIVGVSQGITFKDTDSSPNVSLDLNTDGNISLKASKSITETVDKLSVSLDKSITEGETIQTIAIKNSEESNPSQIEVYKGGVKVSKKEGSYLDVKETSLKGESSTVTIKTPSNVTLELKDNEKSATLDSKGTIELTASTSITDTVSGKVENLENTEGISTLTSTPSEISINSKVNEISSTLSVGLDIDKKEHIEVISPLVDIKTGDTEYTDPHISLSQDSLNLKSTEISLNSKKTDKPSSITLNEGITEKSDTITLQSKSKYDTTKDKDYFTVSLNKTTDNKGNISLSAKDSITESVGNRSISIGTSDIVIEDSTTSSTESKIEVNNSGIVASKGSNSSITLGSNSLGGKSNTVTIETPNNVTFELKENEKTATLSSKGTITLTSNKDITSKEASTTYGDNSIVSKADTIKLQTQGYIETDKKTKNHPHIELLSNASNDYILLEGNKINVYSKGTGDSVSIKGTTLNIKNTNTSITSGTTVAISGTESITETSRSIKLTDSLTDSTDNPSKVSLTLNSNDTSGTIEEKASTSITETVDDTVSLTLKKNADFTHSITLENKKKTDINTPSIIEVNDKGIKASKTSTINNGDGSKDSYIDIQSKFIEEKSNNVTIKTPNKVTLTLNEDSNGSASLTSKGTITLTSQGDAETKYDNNIITTKADTITIKAKGYNETDETKVTNYFPHIELKSTTDKNPVNSVLLEGKTIDISSKDKDSNTGDTITLSGSKLNVKSATTEITSDTINVGESGGILSINTTTSEATTPKITIPLSTATDINSTTIGLGESGSNSTTTVKGSKFEVYTNETLIENDTTISGTTTIKSSSNSENTIVVDTGSTLIKGGKADIKSTDVNIGTETTNNIIIGRKATSAPTPITTLQSSKTEITSPTLNVDSVTVDFKGTNQNVTFKGKGNSSVTSKVPTYIKDTTFSVEKNNTDSSITEVFKVDTSNKSTTINGTTATINPTDVNIGTGTTNAITIGRNATGTPTPTTTLQSSTTNIISPTINIGTKSPSTSVSIGKDSSTVSLKGNHSLLIETNDTTSKVQANDIKFNTSLSSNDIKIRWDSTLNSLVFEKV